MPRFQDLSSTSLEIVPLDACELDQVADRVTTEKARAVGNRCVVKRRQARFLKAAPGLLEIVDIEAEMASGLHVCAAREEVELEVLAAGEPQQGHAGKRGRRGVLLQAEDLAREPAHGAVLPFRGRRRAMR